MTKHDPNQTTRIQRAVKMEAVPSERWPTVVVRTFTGTVIIAVGVAGAAFWSFPWFVTTGMVLIGATTWSTKLVTQSIRHLIPLLREVVSALGGKNGTQKPDSE